MKKLVCICITLMLLCAMSVTSFAAVGVDLNNGYVELNKLVIVEDGVIYLPLRVAFTTNSGVLEDNTYTYGDNPNYAIVVADDVENKFVDISMRRKDENGNVVNGGRFVSIDWSEKVKQDRTEWSVGRMTFIKYDVIDGENVPTSVSFEELNEDCKLIPVNETGDRLFLSLEDWEKVISFITDGDNYEVDIK